MLKEMINGVLAMDRTVTGRDFKINDKNEKDASSKSWMVQGEAFTAKHGVLMLDIVSGDKKANKRYLLAAHRRKNGDISIIYPLPSSVPTWHLATAVYRLLRYEGVSQPKVSGTIVSVHVATPVVLGGEGWQIAKKGSVEAFEKIAELIAQEKSGTAESSGEETVTEGAPETTETSTETPESIPQGAKTPPRNLVSGQVEENTTPPPVIPAMIKHKVYGMLNPDELAIANYLGKWPEARMRELLQFRRQNQTIFTDPNAVAHIANPRTSDGFVWFNGQEALEDGFIRYKRGKALGLESLPGGGKEKYFLTLSYMLYQPLAIILCNGGTTELQLEGSQVLTVDREGHTITGFQQGLALSLLQKGYIVVLDEVNSVNPAYTFVFHDVANGSRKIVSNAAKKDVVIHERAFFAITVNKGTKGTYDMNEAFADRMSWIVLDRLQDITPVIESNVPDLPAVEKTWLSKLYSGLLEAVEQEQIDISAVSIRGFIDTAERLAEGQSRKKAVEVGLLNRLRVQNERQYKKLAPILERETR